MSQPITFFSPSFRVKLETTLRLVQQHTASSIKRYGMEVAQDIQDKIFSDALTILFRTRNDDSVEYTAEKTMANEWGLFVQIITDEFNNMNKQVQALFQQRMPDFMILNKFNLLTVSTCARIVDLLNAEFNMMHKKEA